MKKKIKTLLIKAMILVLFYGFWITVGIAFLMKQKGVRNIFTKKDRQIANQKAMIDNRNKLIKDLQTRNNMLKTENKDLRFENEEVLDTIQKILNLSTSNTYNNDKIVLSKVKELAETAIKNQF